jgi:hypothetical protein
MVCRGDLYRYSVYPVGRHSVDGGTMIQELYLCEKCDKPDATYEGPSGEQWCLGCYSGYCDYMTELDKDSGLKIMLLTHLLFGVLKV